MSIQAQVQTSQAFSQAFSSQKKIVLLSGAEKIDDFVILFEASLEKVDGKALYFFRGRLVDRKRMEAFGVFSASAEEPREALEKLEMLGRWLERARTAAEEASEERKKRRKEPLMLKLRRKMLILHDEVIFLFQRAKDVLKRRSEEEYEEEEEEELEE